MKSVLSKLCFGLLALAGGYGLICANRGEAQSFSTLHAFSAPGDGDFPYAGLVLSGEKLYGTASGGGSNGSGAVFSVNTDGTGFTNLHNFTSGSDGSAPQAQLIISNQVLYGTASQGGRYGFGTVFRINTDGSSFTNLHNFNQADGSYPNAALILCGNSLTGVTGSGIFQLNTDGTEFTNLYNFAEGGDNFSTFPPTSYINADGSGARANLIFSGGAFYGTTEFGGRWSNGIVFEFDTNSGLNVLHSFTAESGFPTNSDGANPFAGVITSSNVLYGTTQFGGDSGSPFGSGTVFRVNSDGTGFTNLHSFTSFDGFCPEAGLVLSGSTLYGTTAELSLFYYNAGTIFAINTDGTGFTNLHEFTMGVVPPFPPFPQLNRDGATPFAGLILANYTLYGTAFQGGSLDGGTVFSLSFAPQLVITASGTNVILSWPTNAAGFDYTGFMLQCATNPGSSTNWNAVLSAPTVNGMITVTDSVSSAPMFYRLSQ